MKKKRKKKVLGRAPVPPPGGKHKDRKKDADKKGARGRHHREDYE